MTKRRRVQISFDEPSLTQQHFKDECDINKIVARFKKTGVFDHVTTKTPTYGDFSNVQSYQDALGIVQRAEDSFDSLPSAVRKRFQNDPLELLAFMEDPGNYDEAVRLGLVQIPHQSLQNTPEEEKVEVVSTSSGTASEAAVKTKA